MLFHKPSYTFWIYFGHISAIFWVCFGYILDMSGIFGLYLGYIWGIFYLTPIPFRGVIGIFPISPTMCHQWMPLRPPMHL